MGHKRAGRQRRQALSPACPSPRGREHDPISNCKGQLATAQAKGKELVGLAEAKALEAQGQAIRSNDALIQLEFAKRWSGNLPVNMYASAPVPFLNLTPGPSGEAPKPAR